jgi:hypothetical protein
MQHQQRGNITTNLKKHVEKIFRWFLVEEEVGSDVHDIEDLLNLSGIKQKQIYTRFLAHLIKLSFDGMTATSAVNYASIMREVFKDRLYGGDAGIFADEEWYTTIRLKFQTFILP